MGGSGIHLSFMARLLVQLTRSLLSYTTCYKGASINDICKIFGFLDQLPPGPHLEIICSIEFMQLPLLRPLDPPPPSDADIISGSSLTV